MMTQETRRCSILGVLLGTVCVMPQVLWAQQAPAPSAAGVRLDPFVLYPSLSVAEGYNDNVTLAPNNQVKSAVTIIAPAILAELKGSTTAYRLGYNGQYGRFSSSTADNYDYHEFRGGADFDFSARSRLRANAEYLMKSDPRGSTLASTGATTPNKYRQAGIGGLYSYGAPGAMGRVEVEAFYTDKRYENNFAVTDTLDYQSKKYGAAFFWRVGPKTEVLFQGQQIRTDYMSPAAFADNTERRIFTGLKWEATAATSGTFKVGYSKKDFTRQGAEDPKGLIWDGTIRWSPLTYSVVDFATGKNFNDPSGAGNTFTRNEYVNARWTHGWTERIRSELFGSYVTDNYQGLGRSDKTSTISAKLSYDMRRWLVLGAEYTHTDRSSSISSAEYKKNLILFSLKGTL